MFVFTLFFFSHLHAASFVILIDECFRFLQILFGLVLHRDQKATKNNFGKYLLYLNFTNH